jgi:hypothetical protein
MSLLRNRIYIIAFLCLIIICFVTIPTYASQIDISQSNRAKLQNTYVPIDEPDVPKTPSETPVEPLKPDNDESLWYSEKLPLKKEHQKLLWDYCNKRNLDYIDMLALIYTESNFKETCSSGAYKGYFQINKAHGTNLSKTLNTPNKPLIGEININWGTAMYSWILADKRVKDLEEDKKRDAALSIFQRGTGGYDKKGLSHSYLEAYYKKRNIVCSYFEKE